MRKRPRIGAMLDKKETNSEGRERSSDRIGRNEESGQKRKRRVRS